MLLLSLVSSPPPHQCILHFDLQIFELVTWVDFLATMHAWQVIPLGPMPKPAQQPNQEKKGEETIWGYEC
jgi:hypothetical protein